MDTIWFLVILILALLALLLGFFLYIYAEHKNKDTKKKSAKKPAAKKKSTAQPKEKTAAGAKKPAKKVTAKKPAEKKTPAKTPAKKAAAPAKKTAGKPAKKTVKTEKQDGGVVCAAGYEEYAELFKPGKQKESDEFDTRIAWPEIKDLSKMSESEAKACYLRLTSYTKGAEFEDEVAAFLKSNKIKGYHKVLSNLYVPLGHGKYTEIDCLLVHISGVYVVECKNYSGLITGAAGMKQWNVSYDNGYRTKLYNPVKQNAGHIEALEEFLPEPAPKMVSKIVFGDDALLKVPAGLQNEVMSFSALKKTFPKETEDIVREYSPAEVDRIASALLPAVQVPYLARLKHIARLSKEGKDRGADGADFESYFG
ncbi:MAG TPA: nuclease-related domain-containing protein [Methanocorpusculum sp.]|nr:nuclease-related domain-containing protein [Methanocorpusculum sp.]